MNGADDPLVLSPVTAAVTDNSFTDAGSLVSADNVLAGRSGDILAPTITAVNGNAGNVGNSVAGTYGR